MRLSGGEVAGKLAGSAAKNAAAMLLALARNHKQVYGKTSLKKILQQTRDIRTFSLTPEQYREFSRQAKDKVLFAGIQDKEQPEPERIINVNHDLDELIEQSVKIVGKPVALMTKEDKVKAIQFLNETGAFLITKSGDMVCRFFGISKYTLYSYIDEA